MDSSKVAGDNLEKELREIKKAFEVLLLSIEAEGIDSSAGIADRIVNRLDNIVTQMKDHYVKTVLEKRFESFDDDQRRFREYKESAEKRSPDEFIDLVGRIERHIATIDREMRFLAPQPPRFVEWMKAHRMKIAALAGSAVLLFALVSGIRGFVNRGKGLVGEYYSGTNFRKLVKKRRDLKIDFVIRNNKGIIRGLTYDNFSVRWNGFLKVPNDGTYEFVTRSDDGVRVWLNGEPIIDNWTVHRPMTDKATRQLASGLVPIKIEWYQKKGGATMQLYWRTEGDAQPKIIEPEFLEPEG